MGQVGPLARPPAHLTSQLSTEPGQVHDAWAYSRGVTIEFIRPGKPVDNCFVERFNGTLRDECLNQHWFLSLNDARRSIGQWREDYNSLRPHSSLGRTTPTEFGGESRSERVDQPPLQVTQRVPLELG